VPFLAIPTIYGVNIEVATCEQERINMRTEDEIQPKPVKSRQTRLKENLVPGEERSDQSIFDDVARTLKEDPFIDSSQIEVQVDNAIITLMGTVENRDLKRRVEECLLAIRGVREIRNNVRALGKETDASVPTPQAFKKTQL